MQLWEFACNSGSSENLCAIGRVPLAGHSSIQSAASVAIHLTSRDSRCSLHLHLFVLLPINKAINKSFKSKWSIFDPLVYSSSEFQLLLHSYCIPILSPPLLLCHFLPYFAYVSFSFPFILSICQYLSWIASAYYNPLPSYLHHAQCSISLSSRISHSLLLCSLSFQCYFSSGIWICWIMTICDWMCVVLLSLDQKWLLLRNHISSHIWPLCFHSASA